MKWIRSPNIGSAGEGGTREGVETGSNGGLVRDVARDASLVLGLGTTNEGGVEDQTILGGVALGLEGAEESFLSTEDLNGRGGVPERVSRRGAGVTSVGV